MIETSIIINILAFVIGMLFHKICSDIIGMGYLGMFVRVVEVQAPKDASGSRRRRWICPRTKN